MQTKKGSALRAHPATVSSKFTGPKHAGIAIDLAPGELTSNGQLTFVSSVKENILLLYQISISFVD